MNSQQAIAVRGVSARLRAPSDHPALPFEEAAAPSGAVRERRRTRNAPWLLLPILAVLTGIGISYVSEHAQATQESYVLAAASEQNSTLVAQNDNLDEQLAQLKSTVRIIQLAKSYGMSPTEVWGYAVADQSQFQTVMQNTQIQAATNAATTP